MQPSTPHTNKRRNWILPALFAAMLFLGGLASDLLANNIGDKLKPYSVWLWLAFAVALIVAAIREQLRSNAPTTDNNNTQPTKPPGDVIARDKHEIHYHYPTTSAAHSLHQLPAPPHDFTGRVAELRELTAQLQTGGATISGVQGMGGVGKTALALKLAEALTPHYPDAQFYLDLQGVSANPLTPAQAMAHVIRAYHPEAKLPEAAQELAALYRSTLHGRRALLVMDNAQDRAQVAPLIPPNGCALLVTSRAHFTLPGLFAKNLNQMSEPEAMELLLRIAPRIGHHAATLAQRCGYLPLALRLAASLLAERADLAPEQYLRRLADHSHRAELVDASLSLSYELLATERQRQWRALAVFPASFDATAAAAVWALAEEAAADALGALMQLSLVEWEEETGRYRLHDLMRDCAARRLSDTERDDDAYRHAAHYKGVLAAADDLYLEGGEAVRGGLALFDAERAHIAAGQAWAAARWDANRRAAQLCIDYPDVGVYLLDLRLHPREQIEWLELAVQAARRLKRRSDEGNALGNLGIAYANLGEPRRAIEYYEQALIIDREIGYRRGEGTTLWNMSLALDQLGQRAEAIARAAAALKIFEEIEDPNTPKVRRKLAAWRGE